MSSCEINIYVFYVFFRQKNHCFDSFADSVVFAADLFVSRHNRYYPAQINKNIAFAYSLDGARNNLPFFFGKFLKNQFLFRFPYFLGDNLLGGLSRDSAEFLFFLQGESQFIPGLRVFFDFFRFFKPDVPFKIKHGFFFFRRDDFHFCFFSGLLFCFFKLFQFLFA